MQLEANNNTSKTLSDLIGQKQVKLIILPTPPTYYSRQTAKKHQRKQHDECTNNIMTSSTWWSSYSMKTVISSYLGKMFDLCTYTFYLASPSLSSSSETQRSTDTLLKDGKLELQC